MNTLPIETKTHVLACLAEGMSIRATVRVTGAANNAIKNLIREVGAACERFHDAHVRYLRTERVQCDEISLAITFFYYNFCRKHHSLKGKTPAMAAGVTDHAFTVRDMLFVADQLSAVA